MALRQVNVKRILAFSGISHAGLCWWRYLIRLTLQEHYCITLQLMH
jgi:NADH:ubiquinone oxidoreductase subunit 2 (subunit N)